MDLYPKFWNFAFVLLILPLITNCRIPDEPGSSGPPSSIQLLPDNVVKTSSSPFGSKGRGRTGSTDSKSFKELQLNICNSGYAKCFQKGKSVPEAGKLIYQTGPNLVTINEVCSNDIAELQSYLAEAWPQDYTYSVFMPAIDKSRNAPYKCQNQYLYGGAVIGRVPGSEWKGFNAYGGKYVTQDSGNEGRTFACAYATGDHFACTTHLSSTAKSTALAQCKALMFDAVPYLKGLSGASGKTVVGGDLNLKYDKGDANDVQYCVPNGYTRKGDGDVQHVTFSNDLHFGSTKKYGLSYTDHDGFLVNLTT
ncbi:hypothetical protein MMC24_001089 [Lignoscripta atroalba]|nr:hypothetical protein [Lignoscripta atroalba]